MPEAPSIATPECAANLERGARSAEIVSVAEENLDHVGRQHGLLELDRVRKQGQRTRATASSAPFSSEMRSYILQGIMKRVNRPTNTVLLMWSLFELYPRIRADSWLERTHEVGNNMTGWLVPCNNFAARRTTAGIDEDLHTYANTCTHEPSAQTGIHRACASGRSRIPHFLQWD